MKKSSEYLDDIKKEFKKHYSKSSEIKRLLDLVKENKGTYTDAYEYAEEVARCLIKTFSETINLKDFQIDLIDEHIIDEVLYDSLDGNYQLVSEFAGKIQEALNREAGIGLASAKPKLNKARINGFIRKIKSYKNIEDAEWLLDEPINNFTMSVVDDVIEKNLDFHFKSGLSPTIERVTVSKCCDWCTNLSGVYSYPNDVPDDIFKRHRYCRCQVLYDPKKNGKVQDSWKKTWKDTRR